MFNDFLIIDDCNIPDLHEEANVLSRAQAPKESRKRSIDRLKFKVPTRFRTDVQKCLDKNQPLSHNQYGAIARTIGDEIESQTISPDGKSMAFAVSTVLDKYPNRIVKASVNGETHVTI